MIGQVAADRPYAVTSWGGFGPGFIVVQSSGSGPPPPPPSDGGCCRGFDCLTRDPLVHWCM